MQCGLSLCEASLRSPSPYTLCHQNWTLSSDAKSSPEVRQQAVSNQMYEKECLFYRDLSSQVRQILGLPQVYGVFIDPDQPKEFFCICMEDLGVGYVIIVTFDQVPVARIPPPPG